MRGEHDKALDLFLLMFNLSQLRKEDTVINVFAAALGEIWPSIEVSLSTTREGDEGGEIEIAASGTSYGFIRVAHLNSLSREAQGLLHNAVTMLATILQKNEQERLLADERLNLQKRIEDRTAALSESEAKYRSISKTSRTYTTKQSWMGQSPRSVPASRFSPEANTSART